MFYKKDWRKKTRRGIQRRNLLEVRGKIGKEKLKGLQNAASGSDLI